jgi:hypothetical protein
MKVSEFLKDRNIEDIDKDIDQITCKQRIFETLSKSNEVWLLSELKRYISKTYDYSENTVNRQTIELMKSNEGKNIIKVGKSRKRIFYHKDSVNQYHK